MSKLYIFEASQEIPVSLDVLWDFISQPQNLKRITPPDMSFEMVGETSEETMYAGKIIAYRLKPLLGIGVSWVTEITYHEPKSYFVDEQRFGPYKFWHHKHFLKPVEGGVEMKDIIHYKLPLGFLGDIANALLVKRKLKQIFDYRRKKLEEIFGKF